MTAPDVRAAMAFVEAGNASVGIVYATDAVIARGLDTVDIFPHDSYGPIVYPVVTVALDERNETADDFVRFLLERGGRARYSDLTASSRSGRSPVSWTLLELTFRVAVVATIVNIPLALAVSWLLVKTRVPGRLIVDVLVSLPLAVPPIAIGFFLLLLLGREGPIGGLTHALLGGGYRVHVVCRGCGLGGGVVPAHGAGDDGCDGRSGRAARNVRPEPRRRTVEGVLHDNRAAGLAGHSRGRAARIRTGHQRVWRDDHGRG